MVRPQRQDYVYTDSEFLKNFSFFCSLTFLFCSFLKYDTLRTENPNFHCISSRSNLSLGEFEMMQEEVILAIQHGASGFVFGILTQ